MSAARCSTTWGRPRAATVSRQRPPRSRSSDSKGVLRDVGVGLRLGISRSSVGTVLHIDMAYPIDREASMRKVQVNVELKRSFLVGPACGQRWRGSPRRVQSMDRGHVVCIGDSMDALPQPPRSHTRVTFLACRSGAREHEIASQRRIAERLAMLLGCAFEEARDEAGSVARPDRVRGAERHPRFDRAGACARHPRRG